LSVNQTAVDPARDIKITVLNDNVSNNPLICSVKIEWAQKISDDPSGLFDLRIDPWDYDCQTPDIWIHRNPFKAFANVDSEGRPIGNGDKPRPGEVNRFYARIHNDGEIDVSNAEVTFYSISPPGIGDNGNWSPIATRHADIEKNKAVDLFVNWTPVVGKHTCLKVYVGQQLGEITGGNNFAQENIFDFEAPASSVPDVVYIPVTVKNPLKERTIVFISLHGVKYGYIVQFPHAWVWLDALEERDLTLTVAPTSEYYEYEAIAKRFENPDYAAHISITGLIPRVYKEKIGITGWPASKLTNIGGIFATVKPKIRGELRISQEVLKPDGVVMVYGYLFPQKSGQSIILEVSSPLFNTLHINTVTDIDGKFIVTIDYKKIYDESLKNMIVKNERDFRLRIRTKAQAFVFDAGEIAETSSNIIQLSV
jgi:hypothetical protein